MNEYRYEYKDYYIQPHKEHPTCYVIVTVGKGGKIPDILFGMYTTKTLAKSDIDKYLDSKPKKEENNDETLPKSRGK